MSQPASAPAPPVIFLVYAAVSIPGHMELPRLADEQRRVRVALSSATRSGRCEILERPYVTFEDIRNVFQDAQYCGRIAAFHFAGHADGYSLLMQDSQGSALLAGAAGLAEFLSVQPGLKLVFLNACSTHEQVSALHAAGVPAVVATHADIPDSEWVVAFAETFYQGLAGGKSIAAAFTEAKAAKKTIEFGAREEQDAEQWDLLAVSQEALAWSLSQALPAHAAAAPTGSLWINVPARPGHRFIDREQIIGEVIERLTTTRPAVAVYGLPGSGKTALAVEIANDQRTKAHFVDGLLWGGLGTQPDPASTLNQWATVLGVELADLPDLRKRAQRLSAAIGERCVLVVLDDAWDTETPELLRLSAPNAVHLLTTRSPAVAETFAGADMAVSLPVLDDEPGYALLQMLAPDACVADSSAAHALVQLVGNLPLALVLLGGFLHSSGAKHFSSRRTQSLSQAGDPATRLALATKRLGAETGGEMTLADAVNLSLNGLPEQVRQAFHALGAFAPKPARFDLDAALAVTAAYEEALGVLIDRNLVEIDDGEQMALHQVVADVARAKMPSEAAVRHNAHYLALVEHNREDWERIQAVYEQVRHAMEQLPSDDARIVQWVWALRLYWNRRGLRQEQLRWSQQALAVAEAGGNLQWQGTLLAIIGIAHSALGEQDQALACLKQALPFSSQAGDTAGEAAALTNIGMVYAELGDNQMAFQHLMAALPLRRQAGDIGGEAATLNTIGGVYYSLGDRQQALAYYEQALPLRRQAEDKTGEAATLNNIASVYDDLGDKQQALISYGQALAILRQAGDRGGEAAALTNIGLVHYSLSDKQQALACYEQALPLRRQVLDKRGEAVTLHNIGSIYADRGDTQEALAHYQQALVLRRQVEDKHGEAATLTDMGSVYDDLGDKQQALVHYQQALPLRRQVEDRRGEAYTLNKIGSVYDELGDRREALVYYDQALPLRCQAQDKRGEATTRYNIALAAAALGDFARAEVELQQLVALDEKLGLPDLEGDRAALEKMRRRRANASTA